MPVSKKPTLHGHIWIRMLSMSALVMLFLVLALVCLVLPFQRTIAFGETSVTAEADTFIDGNEPNKNFGDAAFINIKNNPPAAALLRFNVSGASQNGPSDTHLQLFVLTSKTKAAVTLNVFRVPNTWDEHSLTWNEQPAFSNQLGASSAAPVVEGQWVDIDLGAAVSGDGVYSFAITTDAPDVISFAAHTEANAPQLILGSLEPTAEPTSTFQEETITPTEETETPDPEETETPTAETATEEPTDIDPDATPSPSEQTPTESTEEPTTTPTRTDTVEQRAAALKALPAPASYTVYLPIMENDAK